MVENRWELSTLFGAFDAVESDAHALVAGLSEDDGARRPRPDAWSVAECLDHLAVSNRAYLRAMRSATAHAGFHPAGGTHKARPRWVGRWIAWTLEPPVKRLFRTRAPALSRPRNAPALQDAWAAFLDSHRELVAFHRDVSRLDTTRVRFANPFLPVLSLSLADGLHIMAAHERRHIWQSWRARRHVTLSIPVPSHRRRLEETNS